MKNVRENHFHFAEAPNTEWIVLCCGGWGIFPKWCHVDCSVSLRETIGLFLISTGPHSRQGGKYTSSSFAANNGDRKALLCCTQAIGATFVWIWLKRTPLCSLLALASNFSSEADYTVKPLVYSKQGAMFRRLVPQWTYWLVCLHDSDMYSPVLVPN